MIHLYEMSRKGKPTETEQRLVVARGQGKRGIGSNYLMGEECFSRVMKTFGN